MIHPGARQLHAGEDHIAVIYPNSRFTNEVKDLINQMGYASSKVQGLSHVITTFNSFASSDAHIYMLVSDDETKALGFAKVGPKKLFLWDPFGVQHELNILCLLDFFVVPDSQRKGYGKRVIDKILLDEKLEMKQIPIDRPSQLCKNFMKKHFGLSEFIPQSNNFVVFQQFWESSLRNALPTASITSGRKTPRTISAALKAPQIKTPIPVFKQRAQACRINPITWLPY